MKLVFIVDDDFDIVLSLSKWLQRKGFGVEGFSNSQTLFERLKASLPHIILLDVGLGIEDGRTICRQIRKQFTQSVPIVLFSMQYNTIQELQDSCADDYIKKDATLQELTALLQGHIKVEIE